MMLLAMWVACAPIDTELDGVRVASARLEGITLFTFAALGGPVQGSAELIVTDPAGTVWSVPVDLTGGTFGLGVEISFGGNTAPLDLWLPRDRPILGEQLFSRYRGNSNGLVAVAGIQTRHLRSEHDVRLDSPFLDAGASVMVGYEWLAIRPDRSSDVDTGGFPPITGDTGGLY